MIKRRCRLIWNVIIAGARMLANNSEDHHPAGYIASLRERWRFLDMDHSARHEWLISVRFRGQQRRRM